MDVKFDFEFEGKSFFGSIYRPVAKVTFHSLNSAITNDVWMVIDTGADFTILPKYVALDLGISLEKDCVVDQTRGVGGEQTIYLCKTKINVTLGKIDRKIPLAFFNNNEVPALMGRLGFLETFNTEFLKKHVVVFKN